jgi:hypothetical protein
MAVNKATLIDTKVMRKEKRRITLALWSKTLNI